METEHEWNMEKRKSSRGLVGLFLILGAATGFWWVFWR